ncbi:hypothetical protein, partial [Microvirga aerophila]
RSVGDRLRREFAPGRDILIYVGTTNAEMTELPEHRSRLISAVAIEPKQILETRKIVPPEVWANSYAAWGDRWPHSMAVLDAADMVGPPYPHAREVTPVAYRSFSDVANRGSIVEALGDERSAVMALPVRRITLNLREDVRAYLKLRASFDPNVEKAVRQEAFRMAERVTDRVKRGGEVGVKINPLRAAPNLSDLVALFLQKWKEQVGLCALCSSKMVAGGTNKMLQPSADRIDSTNGAYDNGNVWITHLACNLAKNAHGLPDFEDWIAVIRGADLSVSD